MEEVRASEIRATLEDLMYMSILEKFVLVGVPMLPRLEAELVACMLLISFLICLIQQMVWLQGTGVRMNASVFNGSSGPHRGHPQQGGLRDGARALAGSDGPHCSEPIQQRHAEDEQVPDGAGGWVDRAEMCA
eukprot:1161590-Pelagomonas_calceolata.AAC.5